MNVPAFRLAAFLFTCCFVCSPALAEPAKAPETAPAQNSSKGDNTPAAKVSSEVVTQAEVMGDLAKVFGPQAAAEKTTNPKQFEQIFALFRDQNIGMRLMGQAAEAETSKLEAEPEVKDALKKARSQILIGAFVAEYLKRHLTDDKVKALYERVSKEKAPMKLFLKHTLLGTEAEAKGVIKLLKDGKSFSEVVKRSLDKKSAKNGGALPPFLDSQLPPPIAQAVSSLKAGGFSDKPVSIGGKWEVFLLDKKEKATLEEATPMLKERLRAQLLQELILAEKAKKKVELFDSNGQPTKEVSPVFMAGGIPGATSAPAAG